MYGVPASPIASPAASLLPTPGCSLAETFSFLGSCTFLMFSSRLLSLT